MSIKIKHKELENRLKSLIRPCTPLRLSEGKSTDYATSYTSSNFNGLPYYEKGEHWPINRHTRRPLDFVFQIVNHNEMLPPYVGVLQFFYDWQSCPNSWKQEGWYVKVYPRLLPELQSPPPVHSIKPFCNIHFGRSYLLPSWESMDMHAPDIVEMCRSANLQFPFSVFESEAQKLLQQQEITSFIGGYPQWIQAEATPSFGSYRSKLLVQIDSEELADVTWGNFGSLYLFYHPLKIYDFGFVIQQL